jgi:predicted DCC family thiol-disulfide oxidoreductase YuxK
LALCRIAVADAASGAINIAVSRLAGSEKGLSFAHARGNNIASTPQIEWASSLVRFAIKVHFSSIALGAMTRLWRVWKRKMGKMEMIYDGKCGFCVRSMIGLLAFDGLGQIRVRNFRVASSPVVSDAKLEKALYLVLPDGRALPGFEAYRYVVLRVPGLWGLIPFFYLPVLSYFFGRPIYNWVAANRSKISGWV